MRIIIQGANAFLENTFKTFLGQIKDHIWEI